MRIIGYRCKLFIYVQASESKLGIIYLCKEYCCDMHARWNDFKRECSLNFLYFLLFFFGMYDVIVVQILTSRVVSQMKSETHD